MKHFFTSLSVVTLALIAGGTRLACSSAAPSQSEVRTFGGPTGEFRGVAEIDSVLAERVYHRNTPISLSYFLGEPELSKLLGVFDDKGGTIQFQNGKPNAANMVMYHLSLQQLAKEIAGKACGDLMPEPTPLPTPDVSSNGTRYYGYTGVYISNEFREKISPLCKWPEAGARSDDTLEELWLALVGYDAPQSEFTSWKTFLQSSQYDTVAAIDAIREAVFTALFNPHFLLRK